MLAHSLNSTGKNITLMNCVQAVWAQSCEPRGGSEWHITFTAAISPDCELSCRNSTKNMWCSLVLKETVTRNVQRNQSLKRQILSINFVTMLRKWRERSPWAESASFETWVFLKVNFLFTKEKQLCYRLPSGAHELWRKLPAAMTCPTAICEMWTMAHHKAWTTIGKKIARAKL